MNKDKIKYALGFKKDPDKNKISAKEAHTLSRYGEEKKRSEVIQDMISEIRLYIKEDVKNKVFEHVFKISDKREKTVLQEVKKHFEEMGYDVVVLSDPIIFPITNLLIISWQREDLENYLEEDPT